MNTDGADRYATGFRRAAAAKGEFAICKNYSGKCARVNRHTNPVSHIKHRPALFCVKLRL